MYHYIWKVGEIALAKLSKRVYAKVKIVKNVDGLFHDEKVLAISASEDGVMKVVEQLCYYIEICRTGEQMWLPYTSLHLAERSRPFYGSDRPALAERALKDNEMPRKRKLKEEHILPLDIKPTKINPTSPDLNVTFDKRHMPLKQIKHENPFKKYVNRGRENLFDQFYALLENDENQNLGKMHYLRNVNASTEDKFEEIIKDVVTEKEIENYLHQCWRYNVLKQTSPSDSTEVSDNSNPTSPIKTPVTIHTSWCLVCGRPDKLRECQNCPSSFHLACRRDWLLTVIHRKNPPQRPAQPVTLVKKILSSTRTIQTNQLPTGNEDDLCPSCMWGPTVGYDDVVWHKLGSCQWWPARILTPGSTPSCLLSRSHTTHQLPVKYYGAENYSWGDVSRMSLFLPSHTSHGTEATASRDPLLQRGMLDACDDYIVVYLT